MRSRRDTPSAISAEIKKIEEELAKGGNKRLSEDLAALKNDMKAINLVLQVEGLRDDLTLTGLTAAGTIDIGQTPTSNEYALVGTYHNTLNTIIQGQYIHKAPKWLNYLLMLMLALAMGYIIQRLNARMSIATILISFVALNLIV